MRLVRPHPHGDLSNAETRFPKGLSIEGGRGKEPAPGRREPEMSGPMIYAVPGGLLPCYPRPHTHASAGGEVSSWNESPRSKRYPPTPVVPIVRACSRSDGNPSVPRWLGRERTDARLSGLRVASLCACADRGGSGIGSITT